MGLIFPIQPDNRSSKPNELLALKSSKKRFSLGMGFLFGAALLATMFLAASPLFQLLWTQGGVLDQFLTLFILGLIAAYPLVALYCWFFEEVVLLEKVKVSPDALADSFKVNVIAYEKVLNFRWNHRKVESIPLNALVIENWKGALNVAALQSSGSGNPNRYSTKGHWILKAKAPSLKGGEIALEKRARKDDLDFLLAQIQDFFGVKVSPVIDTKESPVKSVTELQVAPNNP